MVVPAVEAPPLDPPGLLAPAPPPAPVELAPGLDVPPAAFPGVEPPETTDFGVELPLVPGDDDPLDDVPGEDAPDCALLVPAELELFTARSRRFLRVRASASVSVSDPPMARSTASVRTSRCRRDKTTCAVDRCDMISPSTRWLSSREFGLIDADTKCGCSQEAAVSAGRRPQTRV